MTDTPERSVTGHRRLGVVAGTAILLTGVITSAVSCAGQQAAPTSTQPEPVETTVPRESVTHEFVIPDGTAARLAEGEDVDVIPRSLEVRVGDKIRVRNEDSEFARLGIFDVRPGETVTMAFNTPGEMEGIIFSDATGGCGAPPPGVETFVIDVRT